MQYGATGAPAGPFYDPEDAYAPYGLKVPYKRRINGLAILMSVVVPCLIFFLVASVLSFKIHYQAAFFAWCVVLLCLMTALYFGLLASRGWHEKMHSPGHEPSWYRFVFYTGVLAWLLALMLGSHIYNNYTEAYYSTSSMTVYGNPNYAGSSVGDVAEGSGSGSSSSSSSSSSGSSGGGGGGGGGFGWSIGGSLGFGGSGSGSSSSSSSGGSAPANGYSDDGSIDPLTATGQQFMDAGAVYFSKASHIDTSKYMFYSNNPTYCVAPITVGGFELFKYDFWAVGVNCCHDADSSGNVQGYHCGEYNNPEAHAGLRIMKDGQQAGFRLAVMQAEAKFNISSDHPLYFQWVEDPINGGGASGSSSGSGSGYDTSIYAGAGAKAGASGQTSGNATSLGGLNMGGLSGGSTVGATGSGTWSTRHEGSLTGPLSKLWPFFASDFGFGSGGGINTTYEQGCRIYSMGLLGFIALQCTLVAAATYLFSKIV